MPDDANRPRACPRCGEIMPDGEGEDSDRRRSDLVSPLDIAKKWLPWCAALIFAQTLGFTALIAWREISKGVAGVNELIIAVVSGTAPSVPLFVVYAIIGVSMLDFIGGTAMVTAKYLTKKLIEPLERKRREELEQRFERGRAEGVAQGVAQGVERGRAEGVAQGRAEGVAQGVAQGVDQGRARERRAWTEWNRRRLEAEANGLPFNEPPPSG